MFWISHIFSNMKIYIVLQENDTIQNLLAKHLLIIIKENIYATKCLGYTTNIRLIPRLVRKQHSKHYFPLLLHLSAGMANIVLYRPEITIENPPNRPSKAIRHHVNLVNIVRNFFGADNFSSYKLSNLYEQMRNVSFRQESWKFYFNKSEKLLSRSCAITP